MTDNNRDHRPPGFETLAIHAGASPDEKTGARNVPIYQTTAYVFDDADHAASLFNLQTFGYIYTRLTNPTVSALEEKVAALENGRGAVACSSGHAAQMLAMFVLMNPGDNFVAFAQPLRRLDHPVHAHVQEVRLALQFRRPGRPGELPRRHRRADQGNLSGSARQPRRHRRRPRTHRRDRKRGRYPADRRQHHGDALPVPALRLGRGHRDPLDDQVPRRPRHVHGRHRGGERQVRLGAKRQVPGADRARSGLSRPHLLRDLRRLRLLDQGEGGGAARSRPGAGAPERLQHHHRHREPAGAHGPAPAERPGGGGIPRRPPRRRVGQLRRAEIEPVSRAGEEIPAQGARLGLHPSA